MKLTSEHPQPIVCCNALHTSKRNPSDRVHREICCTDIPCSVRLHLILCILCANVLPSWADEDLSEQRVREVMETNATREHERERTSKREQKEKQ